MILLITNPESYPPTYVRGSHCIDSIFGSPTLLQHIEASGMTAFYDKPWSNTDHRGLFININTIGLFGTTIYTMPEILPQRLTSKSTKVSNKFVAFIQKNNMIPKLLKQLTTLSELEIWTTADHRSADNIDAQFTKLLIQAEASCSVPTNNYWNAKLNNQYFIYQYWLTKMRGIKNKRD
jgi:hypothetical protein